MTHNFDSMIFRPECIFYSKLIFYLLGNVDILFILFIY